MTGDAVERLVPPHLAGRRVDTPDRTRRCIPRLDDGAACQDATAHMNADPTDQVPGNVQREAIARRTLRNVTEENFDQTAWEGRASANSATRGVRVGSSLRQNRPQILTGV